MKKTMGALLVLALMLALAVPAAAADRTDQVSITYREIKISVDGKQVVPDNGAGTAVEPFIFGGYTYLPLRAVASALGLGVSWDGATSTIALTTGGEQKLGSGAAPASRSTKAVSITYRNIKITLDGQSVTPKDSAGSAVEPFIMDGTTYLPLRATADLLGVDVSWEDSSSTVYLGEAVPQSVWLTKTVTGKTNGINDSVTTYTYDAKGNVTKILYEFPGYEENNYSSTYSYDANGGLVREDYSDGAYVLYTYDAKGNLITESYYKTGYDWTSTYTYDANSNMVKEVTNMSGDIYTTEYTYDASGQMIKSVSTDPGGAAYTEIITYTPGPYGPASYTYSYSYSDGTTYTQYSNLVYDSQGNVVTEYQYYQDDGAKKYMDTYRYTYDAHGNMIKQASDTTVFEYTYVEIKL